MQRKLMIVGLAVSHVIFAAGTANAVSTYFANSVAVLSLSSSSLNDLAFVGSDINYGANANATANGSTVVDSVNQAFNKNGPLVSFGSFLSGGGALGDLFLVPTMGSLPSFPGVNAVNAGAEARGRNETTTSANTSRFKAEAFGKATDPVESAYSRVRWDLLVTFQNTSTSDLIATWAVSYFFQNVAIADPRGTAFSTSRVRVQTGNVVNGTRVRDPGIFTAETAACGVITVDCPFDSRPGDINQTVDFRFTLAPGETRFLNLEVVAEGNASVVPLPAALPLFGTSLAIIGFIGWRRKHKFPARHPTVTGSFS